MMGHFQNILLIEKKTNLTGEDIDEETAKQKVVRSLLEKKMYRNNFFIRIFLKMLLYQNIIFHKIKNTKKII